MARLWPPGNFETVKCAAIADACDNYLEADKTIWIQRQADILSKAISLAESPPAMLAWRKISLDPDYPGDTFMRHIAIVGSGPAGLASALVV
jgi:hypothetical protein